jgi:hypothetical protein
VNRLAGHFVKKASKPTANRATAQRSAATRLDGVAAPEAFPKGNACDHLKRWKQYGHKATPRTRSKQAAETGRQGPAPAETRDSIRSAGLTLFQGDDAAGSLAQAGHLS